MSSQYDPTVQRILDLMKDTFKDEFNTYYDGDPEAIPLFNLPAIIVTQTEDDTHEAEMGEDDIEDTITIKVVLNKKDDFDGNKVNPLNMTERKIRDYISKRDAVTGLYDPRTVKGALRNHGLDGVTAVANSLKVAYGFAPRSVGTGEKTEYASLTAEGHVTFTVQYSVETQ
jgi:hypothetical protein